MVWEFVAKAKVHDRLFGSWSSSALSHSDCHHLATLFESIYIVNFFELSLPVALDRRPIVVAKPEEHL